MEMAIRGIIFCGRAEGVIGDVEAQKEGQAICGMPRKSRSALESKGHPQVTTDIFVCPREDQREAKVDIPREKTRTPRNPFGERVDLGDDLAALVGIVIAPARGFDPHPPR